MKIKPISLLGSGDRHYQGNFQIPILVVFFILFFLFSIFSNQDIPFIQIQAGLLSGFLPEMIVHFAPMLIAACGMAIVISVGGLDFSMGAVSALTAAIFSLLLPVNPLFALIIALLTAVLCGSLNGFLAIKLREGGIAASLFLMIAGRSLARGVGGGVIPLRGGWSVIEQRSLIIELIPFITLTIFLVLVFYFFHPSRLGLLFCSAGKDPLALRRAGYHTPLIRQTAFVISSFTAGIAGILFTLNSGVADSYVTGRNLEFDSLLAVLVGGAVISGGKLSILATLLSASILTLADSYFGISSLSSGYIQLLKVSAVLVLLLLLRVAKGKGEELR